MVRAPSTGRRRSLIAFTMMIVTGIVLIIAAIGLSKPGNTIIETRTHAGPGTDHYFSADIKLEFVETPRPAFTVDYRYASGTSDPVRHILGSTRSSWSNWGHCISTS